MLVKINILEDRNGLSLMGRIFLDRSRRRTQTNKGVIQASQVEEALILKTSPRARNRGRAEVLLEIVVNDAVVDHRLTVLAIFHLCDLLLQELQVSDDVEVLNEVQNLVLRLLDLAKSQYSFSLMTQIFVLQSRLALLELDIPKAQKLLIQASTLAEEKGLQTLALKIVEEQTTLDTQIHKWEDFIKRKASMSEIIEFIRIENYIEMVVRNKLLHKEVDVLDYATKAQSVVRTFND